ncbi:hypothetical protein [Desulfosporosinus fructosivorans]
MYLVLIAASGTVPLARAAAAVSATYSLMTLPFKASSTPVALLGPAASVDGQF